MARPKRRPNLNSDLSFLADRVFLKTFPRLSAFMSHFSLSIKKHSFPQGESKTRLVSDAVFLRQRRMVVFWSAFILFFVAAFGAGYLFLENKILSVDYEVKNLKTNLEKSKKENEILEIKLGAFNSPDYLKNAVDLIR